VLTSGASEKDAELLGLQGELTRQHAQFSSDTAAQMTTEVSSTALASSTVETQRITFEFTQKLNQAQIMIEEKDAKITKLEKEFMELSAQLAKKDQDLGLSEGERTKIDIQIKQKTSQMDALMKEKEVKDKALQEKDARIIRLNSELKAKTEYGKEWGGN